MIYSKNLFLFLGKVTALRYVTQTLMKILKIPQPIQFNRKDTRTDLWNVFILCESSYDSWMSQIERTRSSIHN